MIFQDAFKIDAVGLFNPNLLGESIAADGIFVPTEVWKFIVSEFATFAAAGPLGAPVFASPGVFGVTPLSSNASIVANPVSPVPIPTAVWLFGSALGLLGWMKWRKAA